MKYEDFEKFVREKCMYDTIYDDSDGIPILIIRMLDAYGMVNKARREWVGLTDEAMSEAYNVNYNRYGQHVEYADFVLIYAAIEAKLKEKNNVV